MAADYYYTCKEIVERQNNTAKKREKRGVKKEIKKINKTTRKMYRKGRDEQRLPFRFTWSYDAEKYAESLGFKLCYATLGFKLKNKAL